MAASASSYSRHRYHVFLSFRGGDTRKNFTDHLYAALMKAGINTFRDDDAIERGSHIESEINTAIIESRSSIVVLSSDYASSRWCLDELRLIMKLRRTVGHIVLPVFYDVDKHVVRNQSGIYGEAFARHMVDFGEDGMDMVQEWKAALTDIAAAGDLVLSDGYESQFTQQIILEIAKKLNRTVLTVDPYLVGIDDRIAHINSWLQDGSNDVGIATIYGVGGIGKTTIAKTVYNQNYDKFESGSFLEGVREASEEPHGLVRLQKQLVSDLLKTKAKIYSVDEGTVKIRNAISRRRILLVLDDVDGMDQFRAIIGMKEWLHPGSKVVITTRYESLLKSHEINRIFGVNALNLDESCKLFSWHAFQQEQPIEEFMELSESAVEFCSGLPLALQVLGSSLWGRSLDVWENKIEKVKAVPDSKIQYILKVSYDSLDDDHDKSLFLDIACFFIGKDKDYVIYVLDGCGLYSVVGIHNLMARCLVKVNEENKLLMHQMVRDMGREIVRQESTEEPGKRSRLWRHKDSFSVLSENKGTESVKGLNLDFFLRKANGSRSLIDKFILKPKAFAKMEKLKLLQLSYVNINGDYDEFPKSLVWLFWRGFSLKYIPDDFHLDKLVVLDIRNSSLVHLWKGIRLLVKLKVLNLSHNHGLVKTPDFRGLPSLETLKMKDCVRLVEVGESIGTLQKLVSLNLKQCTNLKKLPKEISSLKALRKLNISGCSKLYQLPKELGELESLKILYADGIGVNQITGDSKGSWYSALVSRISPIKTPRSINFSLAVLPSNLLDLSLADCNLSEGSLPSDLSSLCSLQNLDLRGNPIRSLPGIIDKLTTLESLCLDRCTSLQSLPKLPPSLEELKAEGCSSLKRIANLPNLLITLQVELFGCSELAEVEGLFKLDPITSIDVETLQELGLFNLEPIQSIEMTMFNSIANRERQTSPQVLHECGISSTFLPASQIPDWLSDTTMGSSHSIQVTPPPSPTHKLGGISLCIVYGRDEEVFWVHAAGHYANIHNERTGINWSYSPSFYGIPYEDDEKMVWLSHWKFGDEVQVGDKLKISAKMPSGYCVSQCGVRVVYIEEEETERELKSNQVAGRFGWGSKISERELYAYQVGRNVYFLHHHPYTTPIDILKLAQL
ncbi:Disease resistance protein RUN1 [Linum perenne]